MQILIKIYGVKITALGYAHKICINSAKNGPIFKKSAFSESLWVAFYYLKLMSQQSFEKNSNS